MNCLLPLRRLAGAALLAAPVLAGAQDPSLADRGVALQGSYTGEAASLVKGGLKRGSDYAGQVLLGADVDLQKFAGWGGTYFHVDLVNRHGRNLAAEHIGNSTSIQEIYGAQITRLANLTVEQHLFGDRLVVEGGRTVANIQFLGSALCAYFQTNSACGNPTFVFRTSGFTYWPVSSWGGHARWSITPEFYAHVGVYEVNPRHAEDSDHGFDWRTAAATGVIVPYAVGYKTTARTDPLPRMVEVGGWFDNSDYRDPLHDANGQAAVLTGQPYALRSGRSGVFARFEQQVTAAGPQSEGGLTVFGAVLAGTSGQLIEDHFLEAGFVQKGTFAGRPHDDIAFVVTQQHYSGNAIRNLTLARGLAGGTEPLYRSQTMMELSYGIEASKQLRIAPNLHYIVHPDSFNAPSRTTNLPNAVAVGVRFDLQFWPPR